MPLRLRSQLITVAAVLTAACSSESSRDATPASQVEQQAPPRVVLETTKGRIDLQLDPDGAPIAVRNFVAHVRAGFYNGLIFHRVKPGFIQAGYYTADMRRATSSASPIMNESDKGRKNLRGTIAMARTDYPHSANTQFFINAVDNPMFDYDSSTSRWGYAVFGEVVSGMDVVDAIAHVRTERRGANEAVPLEPIVIERAYVEEPDNAADTTAHG